jgi:hypothetical protein
VCRARSRTGVILSRPKSFAAASSLNVRSLPCACSLNRKPVHFAGESWVLSNMDAGLTDAAANAQVYFRSSA